MPELPKLTVNDERLFVELVGLAEVQNPDAFEQAGSVVGLEVRALNSELAGLIEAAVTAGQSATINRGLRKLRAHGLVSTIDEGDGRRIVIRRAQLPVPVSS